MQRRYFLAVALSGLVSAACGPNPVATGRTAPPTPRPSLPRPALTSSVPTAAPTAPAHAVPGATDRLLIREGASGHLVAVDAGTGRIVYVAPAIVPSPDWSRWLGFATAENATGVTVYRANDGGPEQTFQVPGRFTDGTLSFDSKWLLLVRPMDEHAANSLSQLALVKMANGTVANQTQLDGRYLPDAVGRAVDSVGPSAYLIQELPEETKDGYAVVLYDADKGAIVGKIADKLSAETVMSGRRVSRAWSVLGDWLYSLYRNPSDDGAFVHALNLSGFTFCIDLPKTKPDATAAQQYSLAVSKVAPSAGASQKTYVVNPALGQISVIAYGAPTATTYPLALPTRPSAAAPPSPDQPTAAGYQSSSRPYNNSVVSPDGLTLYAGSDRGILRIPTRDPKLQTADVLLPGAPVLSLGINAAGTIIYALVDGAERQLMALDPGRGHVLGDLTGLIKQPLGIEQVV